MKSRVLAGLFVWISLLSILINVGLAQRPPTRTPPRTLEPTRTLSQVYVRSASTRSVSLTLGGQPVSVTVYGANLERITSAQVLLNNQRAMDVEATLGPASATSRTLTLKAGTGAQVASNYQVRLIAGTQTVTVPTELLSIVVAGPKATLKPLPTTTTQKPAPTGTVSWQPRVKADFPQNAQELKRLLQAFPVEQVTVPADFVPLPTLPPSTGQKILIILQENAGTSFDDSLPPDLDETLREMIHVIVDQLAETFEDMKNTLQCAGRYDTVVLLTDNNCKRSKLLESLVTYSKAGAMIDLMFLGHGGENSWQLKGESLTGGSDGCVRTLLPDARAQGCAKLNLRMVYTCACWGSTLNDDWLAIGAKAAVGPKNKNYMPEPVTTFFMHKWFAGDKVSTCADRAWEESKPFYALVFPPDMTVVMGTEQVPYPCVKWVVNGCTDPFTGNTFSCWKPTVCYKTVPKPIGVEFTDHQKIIDSKLVVAGDSNLRFTTRSY
jgi:hypothetical protein